MTKLTNKTSGPKAIPTTDRGVLILEPGEEGDFEVAEHDLAAIKRTGMLDKDGTTPSIVDIQRDLASEPIGHLEVNAERQSTERAGHARGEARGEGKAATAKSDK